MIDKATYDTSIRYAHDGYSFGANEILLKKLTKLVDFFLF